MNEKLLLYFFLVVFILPGCGSNDLQNFSDTLPEVVDFNFHIKPILSDRCFACHGPDVNARKGELRLDEKAFAFNLLDSLKDHYVIKSGDLEKSELFQRIISEEEEQMMPPPESNLSLSRYEIELIKQFLKS